MPKTVDWSYSKGGGSSVSSSASGGGLKKTAGHQTALVRAGELSKPSVSLGKKTVVSQQSEVDPPRKRRRSTDKPDDDTAQPMYELTLLSRNTWCGKCSKSFEVVVGDGQDIPFPHKDAPLINK